MLQWIPHEILTYMMSFVLFKDLLNVSKLSRHFRAFFLQYTEGFVLYTVTRDLSLPEMSITNPRVKRLMDTLRNIREHVIADPSSLHEVFQNIRKHTSDTTVILTTSPFFGCSGVNERQGVPAWYMESFVKPFYCACKESKPYIATMKRRLAIKGEWNNEAYMNLYDFAETDEWMSVLCYLFGPFIHMTRQILLGMCYASRVRVRYGCVCYECAKVQVNEKGFGMFWYYGVEVDTSTEQIHIYNLKTFREFLELLLERPREMWRVLEKCAQAIPLVAPIVLNEEQEKMREFIIEFLHTHADRLKRHYETVTPLEVKELHEYLGSVTYFTRNRDDLPSLAPTFISSELLQSIIRHPNMKTIHREVVTFPTGDHGSDSLMDWDDYAPLVQPSSLRPTDLNKFK